MGGNAPYVLAFEELRMTDVDRVGGKNASLGEMISQLSLAGIRVPGGFATTADAFRDFLHEDALDAQIAEVLRGLDVDDIATLTAAGRRIRSMIAAAPLPARLLQEIEHGYHRLAPDAPACVAVRSSATAEDLPDASFAGQQETFLNIVGLDNVIDAVRHTFASLYNDRAIAYRVHKGFEHAGVALSCGIQRMVRSDTGASGVMFTIDTESGFDQVVFITAAYGLGETVVQGAVNPDEFYVWKPGLAQGRPAILRRSLGTKAIKMVFSDVARAGKSVVTLPVAEEDRRRFAITDAEIEELARYAVIIEQHYRRPMDIEWGRDGVDGKLTCCRRGPRPSSRRARTIRRKASVSRAGRKFSCPAGPSVTGSASAQCVSCAISTRWIW